MLKLNNVSKTYISKGKQKVEALKDVNFEMQDRGLVFILGKSGSGKSTLLNILGGIDSATSGEVFVENQSFADFKQADYDNYRNRYVGFVFQEFNLLNDFDVAGNVALALKLSRETEISDKVTNALQSVGLSADYLTRKIDELSGGEKQRVAIARAIVKDSRVILADEPTGNLDSETGESIWNILKNLSKSKLVVVVTHDRESAEKYGDRIIEISDGRIISDSGEQPANEEVAQAFSPQRKSLSNAVCFKMGANNLLQRKIKTTSVILLAIFTIFAILLTQVLLCFSPEKSIAKFVTDNDVEYIILTQGKLRYGNEFNPFQYTLNATASYIENNSTYIKNDCVENKQDILDFGLSFVGEALELDDNSFYLTTAGLEEAYNSKYSYIEIDGEAVKLIKEQHPAEFLIGKKMDTGSFDSMYTVAGVVDLTTCNPLSQEAFPEYFAKESFAGKRITSSNENAFEIPDVTIEFGKTKYSKEFWAKDSVSIIVPIGGKILTEQGLQERDEVTLADNEIVLSFKLYAQLFDVSPKWSYVSTDLTEVISVPQQIGQSFSFKLYDYDSGELIYDAGELKIAGIVFSYKDHEESNSDTIPEFAASANTIRKINLALNYQKFLVKVASINNLQRFLVNFRNKHQGYITYAGEEKAIRGDSISYADFMYGFEQEIYLFKIIFLSIAVLLSIILLLLVINLISFSILNRKKEIGILSALGATNRDIMKIFLIETLLIATITFVFNIVAIIVATSVFNNLFSASIALSAPLLRVDIVTVITLIVSSFGLLLLAALIPLRKIIKLKPIDAIKNL
ncbi:MAG: ABC transporter ATP-binding protein/permease [Clostridia bacterium]|nr:ABC transporter ATP-binding protein/permease [Clostridia bacterium]